MRLALCIVAGSLIVAGCVAPPKMVYVRADGRSAADGVALVHQEMLDETICNGEADKAKLAAGANYHANIFAHAAEEQNRAESVWSVKDGCMAAKGYVRVPETQAPQIAAMLL